MLNSHHEDIPSNFYFDNKTQKFLLPSRLTQLSSKTPGNKLSGLYHNTGFNGFETIYIVLWTYFMFKQIP